MGNVIVVSHQRAEVVRAVRVLPEVVGVNQQVPADRLLKAGIELIPVAGLHRHAYGAEDILRQPAESGRAGEQKVLVERGFHGAGVGNAQNRSGAFDVVGDAEPRLRAGGGGLAVVAIEAETRCEEQNVQGVIVSWT